MSAHTGAPAELPLRVVNSAAPIRDIGRWTDTWFAGHGKIFNIGVYPYVEVQKPSDVLGAFASEWVRRAFARRHAYSSADCGSGEAPQL